MIKEYLSYLFLWNGYIDRKQYTIGFVIAAALFIGFTLFALQINFGVAGLFIQEAILYWTVICLTVKRLRDCRVSSLYVLPFLIKPAIIPCAIFLMIYRGRQPNSGKIIISVLLVLLAFSIAAGVLRNLS